MYEGGGSAGQKQGKKSSGCDGAGMGHKRKKVWEGLGEKIMVIRQAGMDGVGIE